MLPRKDFTETARPLWGGAPCSRLFCFCVWTLCVTLSCFYADANAAEPFVERFDGWEPSWSVRLDGTTVAAEGVLSKPRGESHHAVQQERKDGAGREGRGEQFQLRAAAQETLVQLTHRLPESRVLDELVASVWVRSSQPGWTVGLGVVAPGFIDPRTGQPLRFVVKGDSSAEVNRWTQLQCRTPPSEMRQRLTRLRAQYPSVQNFGVLYVDELILEGRIAQDGALLQLDDLELHPIVARDPAATAEVRLPEERPLQDVPQAQFELDRFLVDGRPFFPRIVRYHGEPPSLLKELGFNVVWIPDVNDVRLIRRLWEQGLWVTATPPRPRDVAGSPLGAETAGLLPFTADVDPVLFWMLGTRLPGSQRESIVHWIEQVEFADRRRTRPIAADVAYDEVRFSRDLDLLGISRHALQSSMSLDEYRQWIQDRRSLARPGTFAWTWLQVEPAPLLVAGAQHSGSVPVVEPEQIRLQAYAAIVAGCRGLGFWTTGPLTGDDPVTVERRKALQQLNLELRFLEPWLATASGIQQVSCDLVNVPGAPSPRNLPFGPGSPNELERSAQLRTRNSDARQNKRRVQELSAFVMRTELGSLILPLWLEGQSQFVPAHGAASQVSFIVPGAQQAAAVVEISTTKLRELRSDRVTGGLQVELPTFDEVSLVWLTSDLALIEKVRQRISSVQQESASIQVEVARLKFDRVGLVDHDLQRVAPLQPDAPQKLGRAKLRLERASSALSQGDAPSAAALSAEVLQLLRILQRDHWEAAVEHLSSPVGSPYTVCYQSLPQHWELISSFGTSRERKSRNLLASGEFEDLDTLIAENWDNIQRAPESLHTSAALFPTGRKSRYALRLECRPQPGGGTSPVLEEPPVTVISPPIAVQTGQIVHISGWVKVTEPITGSRDGLMIYDSLLGRSMALRIRDGSEWTRFEMLRPVAASCDLKMTLCLTGLGQVLIDDLQVIPHEQQPSLAQEIAPGTVEPASASRFFDRLPRFPRMTPLPANPTAP